MRDQTLVINDRKWVAHWNQPEYFGNQFMRSGFWSVTEYRGQSWHSSWAHIGGGPLIGNPRSEEEALQALFQSASYTFPHLFPKEVENHT